LHKRSGAKVVSHGRYVAFQMAEVAIPKNLFIGILGLIAELRPRPMRHRRDAFGCHTFESNLQETYVHVTEKSAFPAQYGPMATPPMRKRNGLALPR
jgi:hypothetical protein